MQAFHFISAQYGLEDITERCLKVATYDELNDPFEMWAPDLSNPTLLATFEQMKAELSCTHGMLCFSRRWDNPVQWSHYADKHRGFCLGFEIDDEKIARVQYSSRRVPVKMEHLLNASKIDRFEIQKWFLTKYSHWKYENEVRILVKLGQRFDNGLYFAPFSDEMKLIKVIVGSQSKVTREQIRSALGGLSQHVTMFKTELSKNSFKVIRLEREEAWV